MAKSDLFWQKPRYPGYTVQERGRWYDLPDELIRCFKMDKVAAREFTFPVSNLSCKKLTILSEYDGAKNKTIYIYVIIISY